MVIAMPCGQATAHPFSEDAIQSLSGRVKTIVETPGNGLVITYSFDQDRHLTEASLRLAKPNQDPSWPRTMKFEYKEGYRLSALLSHPDGFALRTAYGYNDRKQCTAEVTTHKDGTFYEAVLRQYSETGNLTDEMEFTSQGGLIEKDHYEDGTLVSEWWEGILGAQVIKGGQDTDTGHWSEVRYHESSNGSKDDSSDSSSWWIYLYDSHHNLTAMLEFSRNGTLKDVSHNHYEYDKMGNWVVMETWHSPPFLKGESILRFRATREITYFGGGTDKSTP
jgi:hypothetical protein